MQKITFEDYKKAIRAKFEIEKDGVYFNSTTTLLKRNFPFSLQSTINKTIKTNIPDDKNFVWNVTLFYAFKG